MDFLSKIIAAKRRRLEAAKSRVPLARLRDLAQPAQHRLVAALGDRSRPNIIAEFKRRSPSKGPINSEADPVAMARIYAAAGATAISVLTEEDYFDGSLADLRAIRATTSLPLLRKDFIFDEYQVYESAAAGADALLLIVAALDDQALTGLRRLTEDELGLDALVEVHSSDEFERAVACGARLIGVNNRNLRTFAVSTATSAGLAHAAAEGAVLVSESGLKPEDIQQLHEAGYSGFLVGEDLMRSNDPARLINELIGTKKSLTPRVKVCGITNPSDARSAIDAGAEMLGFNFYRPSPRYVEPEVAREIIAGVRAETQTTATMIGVFVNESVEALLRIAAEACLDGVQLHGDETEEYCRQLKARAPHYFVVKVIRPADCVEVAALNGAAADALMLDAYDPLLRGGTGRTVNWEIARQAAQRGRLFLAGGLSPENISEAIATVRPYAVDACSALEVSPGMKDPIRIREFVAAVRASKLPSETPAA